MVALGCADCWHVITGYALWPHQKCNPGFRTHEWCQRLAECSNKYILSYSYCISARIGNFISGGIQSDICWGIFTVAMPHLKTFVTGGIRSDILWYIYCCDVPFRNLCHRVHPEWLYWATFTVVIPHLKTFVTGGIQSDILMYINY